MSRIVTTMDRFLTTERIRLYPVAFLLFALLTSAAITLQGRLVFGAIAVPIMGDFLAHYRGGLVALKGDFGHLYDLSYQIQLQQPFMPTQTDIYVFNSPPFMAYFYSPFVLLTYSLGATVWMILNAFLLCAALRLIWPLVPRLHGHGLMVGIILFSSYPVLGVIAGQDSGLLLFELIAALRLLTAKNDFAGGAVLGLAVMKPHLILLFPILLICQRRWRALTGFLLVALAMTTISVVMVGGAEGIASYFALLTSNAFGPGTDPVTAKMQSLNALLMAILPVPNLAFPLALGGALGYLVIFVRLALRPRHDNQRFQLLFGLVLLGLPFTATHLLYYDLILLVVPVLLLLQYAPDTRLKVTLSTGYVLMYIAAAIRPLLVPVQWPASLLSAPWVILLITILCILSRDALSRDANMESALAADHC